MALFFTVTQLYGSGDEVNILANKINNEFSLAVKSYFSRVFVVVVVLFVCFVLFCFSSAFTSVTSLILVPLFFF